MPEACSHDALGIIGVGSHWGHISDSDYDKWDGMAVYGFVKGRSAVDAAALHSILHDHRRIVEFDGRIDMKLLTNHRCDALVHERTGGAFIVP